jgi:hypothetical protein
MRWSERGMSCLSSCTCEAGRRALPALLVCATLAWPLSGAAGEDSSAAADPLATVKSMGRPPVWKPFTGGYYGLDRSGDSSRSGGAGYVGVYRDLMPSIVGVGVGGEAYVGKTEGLSGPDFGLRALAELRSLFLKAGVDHDFQREDTSFVLSLTLPLRRGGVFGRGTLFRVDWLPGRGHSWNFGLQLPLEPHMGKTRPRDTDVDVPRGEPPPRPAASAPGVSAVMGEVREAARRIVVLSTLFPRDDRSDRVKSLERSRAQLREVERALGETSPSRPNGVRMEDEVRILHDRLDVAFGLAAGAPEADARSAGAPTAALAREVALDEVFYPYNRLFGQYKDPDELWGFAARARERFVAKLPVREVGPGAGAVLAVFDDYLRILEETRAWWVEQLEADARLAWLPFQLALLPEQHDTQEELDAILSRAQSAPLVGGNAVLYSNGQQFQVALRSTIRRAEDYHVLWLHDYDGVDGRGDPDVVGLFITVAYLEALTARVRDFDRTGKLPAYMMLIDLHYWEANKGRLYTDLLQDPLRARARLPKQEVEENRKLQARLERALRELREAVAGSQRLQAEAARRGQAWLRKYVSVHLNVMNPADFSFRTGRLIGYLPIAPDTMVRDHRKLAFFDLTERDPGKGAALYGGVGVGEQYATATWEDRAVLLAGPAALTVKDAARRYLKANGVEDSDIPFPLRPLPKPADYDARVAALEAKGWTATANEVHNERGFARKDASIASAVLYTLMPPGSLIVVPDSIWTHELWAAHLVGAALRGCHVYVIAPAAENAPSAGFPQMSRTREVWSRFVEVQAILGPEIEARGGALRVGLYTRKTGVNDLQAQLAEMSETFERYPFLKEAFPFPDAVYARLGKTPEALAATGYRPDARLPADAQQRAPKLHRKTQLFISRDALEALLRDERVQQVIADQLRFNAREGIFVDPDEQRADLGKLFLPYLAAFRDLPPDVRRRALLYMTVGSLNKDARGMMTDGEVLQVTAGPWAIWAVSDMWMLTGATTWIESQEELDRLLPPYKQWQRRVGRWIRKVL